jgi:hypothetical protein
MNLPPELLEHILLFLSDEPWVFPTLACVSRAWCYPAQSRLYAHVKVTKRVWRKLCQSLQRAPHLRELVRSLEFCVDPWPATRDLPISFAHLFPRLLSVKFGPNTLNGTAFDQLVEAAPGLRSLRLAVSGTAWTDVCALLHTHNSWDRLSISLKRYTGWPYDDCEHALHTNASRRLSLHAQHPIGRSRNSRFDIWSSWKITIRTVS